MMHAAPTSPIADALTPFRLDLNHRTRRRRHQNGTTACVCGRRIHENRRNGARGEESLLVSTPKPGLVKNDTPNQLNNAHHGPTNINMTPGPIIPTHATNPPATPWYTAPKYAEKLNSGPGMDWVNPNPCRKLSFVIQFGTTSSWSMGNTT